MNSDNIFTELDIKVLRVIIVFDSKCDFPMPTEDIVANLSDENEEDVFISINKLRISGYICKIANQGEVLGYTLLDEGSQWFHENNR